MPKKDTKHLFKRGAVWWVKIIRDGKSLRQTTEATTIDQAIAKRDEILSAYLHRDKAEAAAALQGQIDHHLAVARKIEASAKIQIPVAQLWERWLTTAPTASPATLAQYEVQVDRFRRWMAESHAELKIDGVTFEVAAAFVRHMESQKRSANTINKYVMLLRQMWTAILPEQINPWARIEKRKGESISRRPLTNEEFAAVLGRADQELRTLTLLGALLALRLGDACTLRWSSVDLQRGIITVTPRKTRSRRGRPLSLPIVGALRPALASLPRAKDNDFVLPRVAQDYLRHPTYVTDRLQKLFTDCGIETLSDRESGGRKAVSVGFHSLRHFFATQLAAANVPQAVAQAILGHSSPALLATYQHVGASQIKDAVRAVARVKRIPPLKRST